MPRALNKKGGAIMARSLKKGPFVDDHLMKKVEAQNEGEKKSVIKNQLIFLINIHNFCLPQSNTVGPHLGHHLLELRNTVQLLFSVSAI